MKPLISIIIVNYNTSDYISVCIKSLKENIPKVPYEIIIVDNNSDDDKNVLENLQADNIKVFFRNTNTGFGAGCNYAVSQSSADLILLLNPDIIFQKDIISGMFEFLCQNEDAAGCSPSFLNKDGSQGYSYNKFPNFIWELYDVLGKGYNFRLGKINNQISEYRQKRKPIKVDWVTAACLLLKKEIFFKAGGFDEKYFLYYEDVDLQRRIRKIDKSVYCLPYLEVLHLTNVSSRNEDDDSVYFLNIYKSRLIYLKKYFSPLQCFLIRYLHILGLVIRLSAVKFRKKYKKISSVKSRQYKTILRMYLRNKNE